MDGLRSYYQADWVPVPRANLVYVFGSNLAGRHGKGSALTAKCHFGAVRGVGEGPTGAAYAVPTKDGRPGTAPLHYKEATLPLSTIALNIARFIRYAKLNPLLHFHVVRLGCSLAAHRAEEIAPLFMAAPSNCHFDEQWRSWLGDTVPDPILAPPLNLASREKGLGGALTNMTEMAREKGNIVRSYPIKIGATLYPDSESAYQCLKKKESGCENWNDDLMVAILAQKFVQHPRLAEHVIAKGGTAWLETCSHQTGAQSARFQAWEGDGLKSRFIRNLVRGFETHLRNKQPAAMLTPVVAQGALF